MSYKNIVNPIIRYVYLVQEASDAIRMGGLAVNTYTTLQTAYDAANAIQVALGGANKVVIQVGNITSIAAGSLALTGNYNSNIMINGLSRTPATSNSIQVSNLGSINAGTDAITGNAFTIILTAKNVTFINMISNGGAGTTGNGGNIEVHGTNVVIGGVIQSNATSNGIGGNIRIDSCYFASATTTGSGTGQGGDATIVNSSGTSVNSTGGTTGGAGIITIAGAFNQNENQGGNLSVTMVGNGLNPNIFSAGVLAIARSIIGSITQTYNSTTQFGVVSILDSEIAGLYTRLATNTGGWGVAASILKNIKFPSNSTTDGLSFTTAAATTNLIGNLTLEDCVLDFGRINIVHTGASGSMGTLLINDCVVSGVTTVTYGNAVSTPGAYTWSRNRFGGIFTITANGSNQLNSYTNNNCIFLSTVNFNETGTAANSFGQTFNFCQINGTTTFTINASTIIVGAQFNECALANVVSTTALATANGKPLIFNVSNLTGGITQSLTGGSSGNHGSVTIEGGTIGTNITDSITMSSASTGIANKVVTINNAVLLSRIRVSGSQPIAINIGNSVLFVEITGTMAGQTGNTVNILNSKFAGITLDNISDTVMKIDGSTLNTSFDITNLVGVLTFTGQSFIVDGVSSINIAGPSTGNMITLNGSSTLDFTFSLGDMTLKLSETTIRDILTGTGLLNAIAQNSTINSIDNLDTCVFEDVTMGQNNPARNITNVRTSTTGFNTGCEFYNCVFNATLNTIDGTAIIIEKNNLHRQTPVATTITMFIPTYTPGNLVGTVLTVTYIASFLEKALLSGFTGQAIDTITGSSPNDEIGYILDGGTVLFNGTPRAGIAAGQLALSTASVTLTGFSFGGQPGAGSDLLVLKNENGINVETNESILVP